MTNRLRTSVLNHGGFHMKKSHRYLIIQEGNVQIYIANSFKFEDVYTLLSTGEVRVVLFPHEINAWISATEKADKKNIPK